MGIVTVLNMLERLPRAVQMSLVPLVFPLVLLRLSYLLIWEGFLEKFVFYLSMKRSNRVIEPSDRRLSSETFILEYASANWGHTRLWWTDDDVMAISPYSVTTEPFDLTWEDYRWPAFDQWVTSTYLDRRKGKGFLIRTKNGSAMLKSISIMRRNSTVVFIFSDGLNHERFCSIGR